jgi:hypothetical protein
MAKPDNLNEAIFAIQQSGVELKKDASAVYGNYATLGNVLDVLRPLFAEQGITVVQAPDVEGPHQVLRTTVTHVESGDSVAFATPLVLDKETMQGVGSAITYARRYALVSIFLMDADDDDDGNAASGSKSDEAQVTRKRTAAKKEPAEKARAL